MEECIWYVGKQELVVGDFTLIELLVVVAIITAAGGDSLPSLGKAQERAAPAVEVHGSNMRGIAMGMIEYQSQNGLPDESYAADGAVCA